MNIQRRTPALYVLLLAIHLGVLLAVPPNTLAWSYLLVLAVAGVTLVFCWRRLGLSVEHNRPLWTLLLVAIALQWLAFALLLADALVNPQGTIASIDPTFFFCLHSLFLVLASTYSMSSPLSRFTRIVDGVLAIAIAGVFYLRVHEALGASPPTPASVQFFIHMFDALDGFVVCVATLRLLASRRADERRFFFVLTAFAWCDALFPAAHNRLILASESYVPELLLSLPFAVLGVLLSRRRTVWFRGYRPSRAVVHLSQSIIPFILSLSLCLLAFSVLGVRPWVGEAGIVLAILAYAVRNTIIVSHHRAIEEELKRLRRGLEHIVVRDELTSLLNRRGLYRQLRRDWQRHREHGLVLTVAMIDIDNFKAFNDTYGHLAGDDCLAIVANALARMTRTHPMISLARYGGEEFAVLLPGYSPADGMALLEAMRERVASLQILHAKNGAGVVTISAGLASTGLHAVASGEKLLDAADQALFESKHGGRNQVRLAAG